MDWSAVGAVGEVLGALAVVVSLVYVGAQVRLNTAAIRAETAREVVASIRAVNTAIASDPELNRIFMTYVEDPDALPFHEQARALHVLFNFFRAFEDAHHQFATGNLEPDIWAGWGRMLSDYMGAPGLRRYWHDRRDIFSADFAAYVDGLGTDPGRLRPATKPAPAAAGGTASPRDDE